jgi:hypothetical protein
MNLTPSAFSREYNYPFKLCKQTLDSEIYCSCSRISGFINSTESFFGIFTARDTG